LCDRVDTPSMRVVRSPPESRMAKKKPTQLSGREQRQLRMRQVLFTALAILVIASFVLSLLNF